MKTTEEIHFNIYLMSLRFITYKVTENLRKLGIDIDDKEKKVILTAYYNEKPSDLESELLNDIETNIEAHLPHHFVISQAKFGLDDLKNVKHKFILFSFYEEY